MKNKRGAIDLFISLLQMKVVVNHAKVIGEENAITTKHRVL